MMLQKDLQRQLKTLTSDIAPREEWAKALENRIRNDIRTDSFGRANGSRFFLLCKETMGMMLEPWKLSPLFVFVLIAVFVFVAGSGIIVKDSVPGDPLFTAKTSFEKARLFFAITEDNKADVHVSNVEKRVTELRKIVATDESDTAKEKRVKELVKEVREEIAPLQKTVPKLKKIKTVMNIQRAGEYVKAIDKVVSDLSVKFQDSEEVTKGVKDIKKLMSKTNTNMLVVIAAALEQKEDSASKEAEKVITKSEVESLMEDVLNTTIKDAVNLQAKIEVKRAEDRIALPSQKTPRSIDEKDKNEDIKDKTADKGADAQIQSAAATDEKMTKTQEMLGKAQDSLSKSNLVDTITTIVEVKELLNSIEENEAKEVGIGITEEK